MRTAYPLASVLVAVATLLAGCSGTTANNIGISNTPGSFSFGGQVTREDGTMSYEWRNPSTQAEVSWGGQLASGSIELVIKDASGRQVYSGSMSGANSGFSGTTQVGAPGEWEVRITFRQATANMGLSIMAR